MDRPGDNRQSFGELEALLGRIEASGLRSLSGGDVVAFGHRP